jgi:hypothetical protein
MPWFVKDVLTDGVLGPLSDEQFKGLANSGQLVPDSEIAKAADGPWLPAARVKGLFGNSAPVSPIASVAPAAASPDPPSPAGAPRLEAFIPAVQQGVSAFKEKARAYVESQALDQPIHANNSLFVVVWKLILGSKEYAFHDDDFPALAACLRIGASLARVWFCLFGIAIIVLGCLLVVHKDLDSLRVWCALSGENIENYYVREMRGLTQSIEVTATPLAVVWAVAVHCIKFLAIMGSFEFIRVILSIEKNTRLRQS